METIYSILLPLSSSFQVHRNIVVNTIAFEDIDFLPAQITRIPNNATLTSTWLMWCAIYVRMVVS